MVLAKDCVKIEYFQIVLSSHLAATSNTKLIKNWLFYQCIHL